MDDTIEDIENLIKVAKEIADNETYPQSARDWAISQVKSLEELLRKVEDI